MPNEEVVSPPGTPTYWSVPLDVSGDTTPMVQSQVCMTCGSRVGDVAIHTQWHIDQEEINAG